MTEPDLQFIGRRLNELQAEMRTIRSENALPRGLIHNAFDGLSNRLAEFEVSIGERLIRIETLLDHPPRAGS